MGSRLVRSFPFYESATNTEMEKYCLEKYAMLLGGWMCFFQRLSIFSAKVCTVNNYPHPYQRYHVNFAYEARLSLHCSQSQLRYKKRLLMRCKCIHTPPEGAVFRWSNNFGTAPPELFEEVLLHYSAGRPAVRAFHRAKL